MVKKADEMLWKDGESASPQNIRSAPRYCDRDEIHDWRFTYPTEKVDVGPLDRSDPRPRTFYLEKRKGITLDDGREVTCYVVLNKIAGTQGSAHMHSNSILAPKEIDITTPSKYPGVPELV